MTDINPGVSTDPDHDQQVVHLVRRARKDPGVFGDLYRLYVEAVFRYLYSRIGSVPEAEDVTSQVFLVAFETLPRLRKDRNFPSWLFTIARNKAMDHFRQGRKKSAYNPQAVIDDADDTLANIIQNEQIERMNALIGRLPEAERELLRLRFLAGMSFPQMARVLDRKEAAVKKSVYRLLDRLQNQMELCHE